jgi:hypothetical protein
MKIKDVVQLSEAETVDQRIERATKIWVDEWNKEVRQNPAMAKDPSALQQFGASLARDKTGQKIFLPKMPTALDSKSVEQYIKNIVYIMLTTTDSRNAVPGGYKTTLSPHLQQFSISDEGPPLKVFYKKNEFMLNPDTGAWVSYPGGKPVPEPLIRSLNQYIAAVKPATIKKPTATPTPAGTRAITVTDNAGIIWTKDEDNNRWLNDAGVVVTDPKAVAELEKRALTQYQARQMST